MALALYRTYRPGRFADVVGQEHVTGPLIRALANDRVHHAYLFSGPRGCGKTSSARVLARSLNCEQGPTSEPCGSCRPCQDLAPNGPGSIDVVELDAATHGLVDDARELREKAHFAPVSSRYKIYIIDEAHQLGPGAANALLKLIEEPPPHLRFIFATTAPDKILGTIRSRTHHYPFRLIPARTLQQNLSSICAQENIPIEPAALALVARAAAGSARDAQSILGQLIAGAGDDGVTYDLAVSLLGFTDAALLDDLVDSLAAADAASVFAALDRVMDSGHDPRRFLTDLLERFRDLIVVQSVPDASSTGLIEAPEDEAARMTGQAARFGMSDLVRLADVVDEGITAMKGATPTRLQLELVCARLLLPGADDSVKGVQARLDRLERRLAVVSTGADVTDGSDSGTDGQLSASGAAAAPAATAEVPVRDDSSAAAPPPETPAADASTAPPPSPPRSPGGPASSPSPAAEVRRLWPEVLVRLREIKKTPWSLISQDSAVANVADGVLTLAFTQPSLRDTFMRRDDFQTALGQALSDVLGAELRVEAIVDPSADPTGSGPSATDRAPSAERAAAQPATSSRQTVRSSADPQPATTSGTSQADSAYGDDPGPPATRQGPSPARGSPAASSSPAGPDDEAHPDDTTLDTSGLTQRELLERTLGAQVIDEVEH